MTHEATTEIVGKLTEKETKELRQIANAGRDLQRAADEILAACQRRAEKLREAEHDWWQRVGAARGWSEADLASNPRTASADTGEIRQDVRPTGKMLMPH